MVKQERERLLLPDHEAERGAGELVGFAQLILQIFQVRRREVFRMADKQGKDRRFGGHLRDIGGLRHSRRLVLAGRQRMGVENFLQPGIQRASGDTLGEHRVHVLEEREKTVDGVRLKG